MTIKSNLTAFLMALLLVMVSFIASLAAGPPWGALKDLVGREWITQGEPNLRVTRYHWEVPGKILVARHGPISRVTFGDARFADTTQRFVLQPDGTIAVTYNYEDGRKLEARITVQADGTAVETFTDANGVQGRNFYRGGGTQLSLIERQRMMDGVWTNLGTTRRAGATEAERAQIALRQQQEREMRLDQERAQQAARQAAREAEQAARVANEAAQYAAEQSYANNAPVSDNRGAGGALYDMLTGLNAQVQQDVQRSRAQLDNTLANAEAQAAAARAAQAQQEADRRRAEANRAVAAQEAARRGANPTGAGEPSAPQIAPSTRPNVQGQLGQTPLGGFPAPVSAPNGRTPPPMGSGGTQFGAADLECLPKYANPTYQPDQQRCQDKTKPAGVGKTTPTGGTSAQGDGRGGGSGANWGGVGGVSRGQPSPGTPTLIDMKEGVVLCKLNRGTEWRCEGPLQVTYGNIEANSGAISDACGSSTFRDLGVTSGYKAFGCGFGMHPTSNSPGNRDVPALLGVYVPGRATYRCPFTKFAYCRG